MVDVVRCPRKGPLGADISLVICGQMYASKAEACAEYRCKKAVEHEDKVRALRLMTKCKQLSYREIFRLVASGEDLKMLESMPDTEESEEQEEEE